jgi:membrane protease YdiL (CAAX protease family)
MKSMNRTTLFLLITFVISYTAAGIFYLAGGRLSNGIAYTLFGAAYMFIPMLAAFIVKKLIHGEKMSELLISFKLNRWFAVAWLLMPLAIISTIGTSLLFPQISYSPGMEGMFARYESILSPDQIDQMKISMESLPVNIFWITLVQGLIAGITINALAGFGEEIGWRGFLLRELCHLSFWKISLFTGFIWGIWHAPLILMGHNYPQHPVVGVLMMIVLCILLTPIFIYITLKARSVIAAAVMHGTMNATAGLSILVIAGGNDLIAGITGLAGFITIAIVILMLFIFDTFISKDKIFISKISEKLL